MADITYVTKDHPEANGRTPGAGEQAYGLLFPLESGQTLEVIMGKQGICALRAMLRQMDVDDALGEALSQDLRVQHAEGS
jgi:hypothetical protein